jgi:ribonuclease-3
MPRSPRRRQHPEPPPAPSLPEAAPEDEAAEEAPRRLADALGLTFKDLDILRLALTHRSVLHDWMAAAPESVPPPLALQSNERLEFLGDAVLGFVVADHLYHRYPEAGEGLLTAKRVALVRAERLVQWAREIDLGGYLYLGQGERVTENARDKMLAGAFEAVIGAITIDQGLRATRRFLRRFITRDEAALLAEISEANPKGRLQELLQERFRTPPVYRLLSDEGPAHARTFVVEVSLNGEPLGVGMGSSKRAAEQEAAIAALAALRAEPRPVEPEPPASMARRRHSAPRR